MKTHTQIEPGLLSLLRLTIGLWLVLLTLGILGQYATAPKPLEPFFLGTQITVFIALFLFLYLYSGWLQHRLGWWYLPLGLMITSMGPIIVLFLDMSWLLDYGMSTEPVINFERRLDSLFLPLFITLVFISAQYGFKAMLAFTLGTTALQTVIAVLLFPVAGSLLMRIFTDLEQQVAIADQTQLHIIFKLFFQRLFLFIVTGFLVTRVLSGQKTDRKALREKNIELARYATTVEQLSVSHERNRMARELHDTLAHTLSAVSVQLEALNTQFGSDTTGARQTLKKTRGLTRTGLQEVRRALYALRASPLEDLGLALAMCHLAESTAERAGIEVDIDITNDLDGLRPEVEQSLYRIAEEALNNAVHHANSQNITVSLSSNSNKLQLTVSDNGIGFDPESISADGHFGIKGMHERAMLCNGHLDINSKPGKGTTLHLIIEE